MVLQILVIMPGGFVKFVILIRSLWVTNMWPAFWWWAGITPGWLLVRYFIIPLLYIVLVNLPVFTMYVCHFSPTFFNIQSYLQVHRLCIVHKQPRIQKLSWLDVSCWTWDQGHHREHHFCFLPRFTTVDWEGWSTSHFHLRQTRWFQFPHHKLTVPE